MGGKIKITNIDSNTTYYHGDHLGSSRVMSGAWGYPVWQGTYLPFGYEYNPQITTNHYKFTGKERDAESGLDYFGARYYGSSMGRWLTPDWSTDPVPLPYADLSNPQSLNLYGYVNNNPMNTVDPDGHCCLDEIGDFVTGVMRGVNASFSLGTLPGSSPQATDSIASRIGQGVGTVAEGIGGVALDAAGGAAIGVGAAAEGPSLGTSTALVGAGVAAVGAGTTMVGGAIANLERLVNTPIESRRTGDFSSGEKKQMDQSNANKNGGQNKCTKCGRDVQKIQNRAGQSTPGNQLQRHHDPQLSKGGNSQSPKNRIVCRDCHIKIHKKKN